ncbi:glycoprotein-N-acetylgalactosamine 3-beta-galactosyltransferase 1-like [Haemaphysalis longicornis]
MAHNRRSRFPGLHLVQHSRRLRRLRRFLSAGCSVYVVFGIGIAFGLALSSGLLDLLLPQQQSPLATAIPKNVPPPDPHDPISYDLNNTALYIASDWVAKLLHSRVRVLCWVLTHPKNIRLKARHVAATWGRRCTKLLFMSTKSDKRLPSALELSVSEKRNALWAKTKASLVELYKKHYYDYDWFLKADDDTYVVMENLRFFLLDKDPSKPVYFGYPYRVHVKGGYVSGGSGYVLSREALRLVVEEGLTLQGRCRADSRGAEDIELARCLSPIGIQPDDTRDALGRHRFLPVRLESFLVPGVLRPEFWLWRYSRHPIRPGPNCCSDTAASFHYIKPRRMYIYEFFVYHVRVVGGTN